MVEPISATLITAIVGLYTAYTQFKAAQGATPTATQPADATQGAQVAPVIETGIQQYGGEDDHADLTNFQRNPARYQAQLITALTQLANSNPAFAAELRRIAGETGADKVQNITGESKVENNYGVSTGVNTGTITMGDVHSGGGTK